MVAKAVARLEHWHNRLDFIQECLWLPNGKRLMREDMTLLHEFLHGIPRKTMATKRRLSVKAIERRLSRVRDALEIPGSPLFTLHGNLQTLDLTLFLLAERDWFDVAK